MNKLLALFQGFSKHSGPIRSNPVRDWHVLLVVTTLLLVASVGWNIWFFGRVVDEGVEVVDTGQGTLDAYQAGAVKEIFDMRAAISAAYRETFPFVDPSR